MDIKIDVQQQFGKSADSYVQSKIHKEGKDLQKLVTIADVNGNEELLDIATGGGHTANAFAAIVKKVTAVDLTKEMLEAAEKFIKGNGHENVQFIRGDAEKLPFSDGAFDIVTCRIAPHHFPHIQAFASEVYRVLKAGGQFLLDDNVVPEADEMDQFYNKVEKMRDYSHFRAWKKSEWIKLLESTGFTVEEFHHFEKQFIFEPWCNRMKLPMDKKDELTKYMLQASEEIKEHFEIKIEKNQVISFKGEAVVLKAVKKVKSSL